VLEQEAPTEGMAADGVVQAFRALAGPEQVRVVASLLGVPWEEMALTTEQDEGMSEVLEEDYETEDDEALLAAEFGILPLATIDLPDPLAPPTPPREIAAPVDPQLLQPPDDLLAELFSDKSGDPIPDAGAGHDSSGGGWPGEPQSQGNLVDDLFGSGDTAGWAGAAGPEQSGLADQPTAELPQLAPEANPVHRAELGLPMEAAPDPWDEDEFFSRGRRFR